MAQHVDPTADPQAYAKQLAQQVHWSYARTLAAYTKTSDALDGQDAVRRRAAGRYWSSDLTRFAGLVTRSLDDSINGAIEFPYVPPLAGHLDGTIAAAQAYHFFASKGRLTGLTSKALKRFLSTLDALETEITVPAKLAPLEEDADGLGHGMDDVMRDIRRGLLSYNRCAILLRSPDDRVRMQVIQGPELRDWRVQPTDDGPVMTYVLLATGRDRFEELAMEVDADGAPTEPRAITWRVTERPAPPPGCKAADQEWQSELSDYTAGDVLPVRIEDLEDRWVATNPPLLDLVDGDLALFALSCLWNRLIDSTVPIPYSDGIKGPSVDPGASPAPSTALNPPGFILQLNKGSSAGVIEPSGAAAEMVADEMKRIEEAAEGTETRLAEGGAVSGVAIAKDTQRNDTALARVSKAADAALKEARELASDLTNGKDGPVSVETDLSPILATGEDEEQTPQGAAPDRGRDPDPPTASDDVDRDGGTPPN